MARYEAPTTDDRRIWDLFLSGTYQGAVVAADDTGIFASLAEAPATIAEIARRLDLDERATGILLRLLASLGLLIPRLERFHLSGEARLYLLKSSPFYWGEMMRVAVSEWHRDTLMTKLKQKGSADATGPEGAPQASGKGGSIDGWAAGHVSIDQARQIAARMHSHSLPAAIGAARHYDFKDIQRVLDVGGGSGCFMIAMAQAHHHLRCTIMDLPAMCEVAQTYIKSGEVAERVDTIAVDMFRQPWPHGYDAIFFSNVWHDWNFRVCKWLAERAFEILRPGGRVMLHEMLIDDDGAGPVTAAAFSMLMLLATQGQQFTLGELQGILESAGFTGIETNHTYGYYSIVTGYKP
jgi:2-polyprenyl-3-methyl-5-hydroxy-6-metoxy-1,4-benzoquinol methylase